MFDLPCAILAGGKSSRMGRDKSRLPFGKYQTLLEYQYHRLSPLFTTTIISSKQKNLLQAPHIQDHISNTHAPMIALYSLLKQLDSVFVIAVDMPFVDVEQIERLVDAHRGGNFDISVAQDSSGIHPLCAIYNNTALPQIRVMLAQHNYRLTDLLNNLNTKQVLFEQNSGFINLNYYHEYKKIFAKNTTLQ